MGYVATPWSVFQISNLAPLLLGRAGFTDMGPLLVGQPRLELRWAGWLQVADLQRGTRAYPDPKAHYVSDRWDLI